MDVEAIRRRLDVLKALGPGWDSYGALEVEESACERVMRLVEALPASCPAPWVVPTPSGGVQLEWRERRSRPFLEVETTDDGWWWVYGSEGDHGAWVEARGSDAEVLEVVKREVMR